MQSPVEAVVTELITLDEDRLLTKQFNTDNAHNANGNAGGGGGAKPQTNI